MKVKKTDLSECDDPFRSIVSRDGLLTSRNLRHNNGLVRFRLHSFFLLCGMMELVQTCTPHSICCPESVVTIIFFGTIPVVLCAPISYESSQMKKCHFQICAFDEPFCIIVDHANLCVFQSAYSASSEGREAEKEKARQRNGRMISISHRLGPLVGVLRRQKCAFGTQWVSDLQEVVIMLSHFHLTDCG